MRGVAGRPSLRLRAKRTGTGARCPRCRHWHLAAVCTRYDLPDSQTLSVGTSGEFGQEVVTCSPFCPHSQGESGLVLPSRQHVASSGGVSSLRLECCRLLRADAPRIDAEIPVSDNRCQLCHLVTAKRFTKLL